MVIGSAADTLEDVSESEDRTGGIFVQNVLGYKDRLFLTLGGRADYSSVFGEETEGAWQLFPKVSASYVISDEPFWPAALGQLRLRGAYVQAGRAPGTFDAVRTWASIGWGGNVALDPEHVGNDGLDPEHTSEIELGFDAELLNNRLALDFTYYHQKTSDTLFEVRQLPSSGQWDNQLMNVGTIQNRGFEVAGTIVVLPNPNLGWDLGVTVYTNESRVLDLGGAPPFSMDGDGWILPPDTSASGEVTYYSLPEIRAHCIIDPADNSIQYYTSTLTGTPTIQNYCTHGPSFPTLTLGFNTTIRLPKGIQIVARGEYQGGHYVRDDVSSNALTRAVRWPYCFEAYPQIAAGNEGNLSTWLQSTCIPGNADGDYTVYPADFFKLRELSLRLPVDFALRGSATGTMTLSARNAFRWINPDFPVFDPEMMGDEGTNAMIRSIGHHVPLPATFTAFLRVAF
jgi:hypothetical protein